MRTTICLLVFSGLGLVSCSDDPQMSDLAPERPCSIDTVLLATSTTDWVSYEPADTALRFENDSGQVRVFRQRYYKENFRTSAWDGLLCNDQEDLTRYSNTRSFWCESEDSLLIFGNHNIRYLLPSFQTYESFAEAPPYEVFVLAMQVLPPQSDTVEINSCVARRLVNDFDNNVVRNQRTRIEDIRLRNSVTVGSRQFDQVFEPTDCQGYPPPFTTVRRMV
jgi:hypothetical protein